jgi:U3 small nucleolar RNA-associated protein 11
MPFASLKNAEKRRSHKERAQPLKRRKLGLLEKHSDYVKRARNYNSKKQRIRALQRKAAERNPDEFNFGMVNSKTRNGVHVVSDSRGKLSADMHMLIKTQDLTYATMAQTTEKNKIEKLKASLHCLGAPSSKRKHTIFVDNKEEAKKFSAVEYFDTEPEYLDRAYDRPRRGNSEEGKPKKLSKKILRQKEKKYKELEERIKRERKLNLLRIQLQTQKNLLGKGQRKKIKDAQGDRPAVYKWKMKRKR